MYRSFTVLPLCVLLVLVSAVASASNHPLATTPDEAAHGPASATNVSPLALPETLLKGIWRDQKPIWLFPLHAVEGQHWRAVLPIVLGTTALVGLDPHDAPYFRRTATFDRFNRELSGGRTDAAEVLLPLGWYFTGLAARRAETEHAGIAAGEALVDAELVAVAMKAVDRRRRPSQIPPAGDFSNTWLRDGLTNGSFPSGHTIGAFALASVLAHRYSQHHWLPWLAYGLAGLVGFSRVTLQAHFPSDVFAGAALGYSIGRVVAQNGQ